MSKPSLSTVILFCFFSLTCKQASEPQIPLGPDTTSHGFSWTFDTSANVPGTILNDVVLVSDSVAYIVGRIYSRDSSGNILPFASNTLEWDGFHWSLKKLLYSDGSAIFPIIPIRGILVHGRHEAWLSSGSIWHWEVDSTIAKMVFSRLQFPDPNVVLTSLASNGTLPVYGYGTHGQIVVWDGTSWTIQQTGTVVDISDVWVDASGRSVWACGYGSSLFLCVEWSKVSSRSGTRYSWDRCAPGTPDAGARVAV